MKSEMKSLNERVNKISKAIMSGTHVEDAVDWEYDEYVSTSHSIQC